MITIVAAIIAAILGFISAYILFKLNQRDSFITAILESRISAAQDAYSQALSISQNIHADNGLKSDIIREFETWFRKNSLKLPKEIRDIIRDGVHYVSFYSIALDDYKNERRDGDAEAAEKKYKDLKQQFDFIMAMPKKVEELSDKLFNKYMDSKQLGIWWFIKSLIK